MHRLVHQHSRAALCTAFVTAQLAAQSWQQLLPATSPPLRARHGLAFDAARGNAVLFGGYQNGTLQILGDTWLYDGANWSPANPLNAPSARCMHGMTYDNARRVVVLFGGGDVTSLFAETWEFDGTVWRQIMTAHAPSPRSSSPLVHDAARGRTVLFGGEGATFVLGDTWEYDGIDWQQIVTASAPSARSRHALAYDAARGNCVLFGGYDPLLSIPAVFGLPVGETWLYSGTAWTRLSVPEPSPRMLAAAAYSPIAGLVVLSNGQGPPLIGGHGGGTYPHNLEQTWTFDGASWSQVLAASPPARSSHALVWFGRDQSLLTFAGDSTWFTHNDTWSWEPPASAAWSRYGLGCSGSTGTPDLDRAPGSQPVQGSLFTMQLSSLPGPSFLSLGCDLHQWAGAALPRDLDAQRPHCRLWLAPLSTTLLLPTGGVSTASLAIPINAALVGLVIGAQALALDPGVPAGFALTNGALLRIR